MSFLTLLSFPLLSPSSLLFFSFFFSVVLTEHWGGRWPFWLSPRQAIIVPIDMKVQYKHVHKHVHMHMHIYAHVSPRFKFITCLLFSILRLPFLFNSHSHIPFFLPFLFLTHFHPVTYSTFLSLFSIQSLSVFNSILTFLLCITYKNWKSGQSTQIPPLTTLTVYAKESLSDFLVKFEFFHYNLSPNQ